jgi:hypothetical protein
MSDDINYQRDSVRTGGGCVSGKGCCLGGCIGMVAFVLLACLGLAVLIGGAVKTIKGYVAEAPSDIEIFEPSPAEKAAANAKFARLHNLHKQGKSDTVRLSATDLNSAEFDDREKFLKDGGKYRFDIVDDKLQIEFSAPLDEWGPDWQGKFANGRVEVGMTKDGDDLQIDTPKVLINDKQLPGFIRNMMNEADWGHDVQTKPDYRELRKELKKYDGVKIENGELVLTTKGKAKAKEAVDGGQ